MMFFMLYGPYGVDAYNFEITPALSMETRKMDRNAMSSKTMNSRSMKKAEKEESTYLR
jgi:hypothetical protein